VPKKVDHDERRRQIADGLLRIAATRGLHQAGLREVAAESGVSVRLIQYYFGDKEQLLLFALMHLARKLSDRALARIQAAGSSAGPRAVVSAILLTFLPDDEESRAFNVAWAAYAALALTDPGLGMKTLIDASDVVEKAVAGQLAAAQEAGIMDAALDPAVEATSLLALSAGLGTSVLHDQRSPADAARIIAYHLDRLLPAERG